jgi:type IV secretion system protein VirB6
MGTAQNIDVYIDELLLNFVNGKSAALCSALVPVAVAGLSIYWIQAGLNIADGSCAHPVRELLRRLMRISWIAAMSMSVGVYQMLVVGSIDALGAGLIEAISGVSSFAALLDNLAEPFEILGSQLWSKATVGILPNAALLFAAAVVSIAQSLLFSVGIGFYLLAKVSLALIMAVGPVFLLCAMWTPTMKYAENWLGQALNYMFLKVLICVTVTMLTSFVSQYAQHISNNLDAINILQAACALLLSSIALVIIMLFHPQLASALFGGASVAGAGRAALYGLLYLLSRPNKPPAGAGSNNNVSPGPSARRTTGSDVTPLYQRNTLARLR